ncbi:flavodoxin domain-containing protein [Lacticaseibacillus parahuelsenbergensis]|uniref:Flavodoxin domain-containing protein n=1 Tax=Lacticaseibacillus parahuelsenbergensis TaxID=3068305 RepID=A0ABY9L4X4_9LACO|nr:MULTISPECIES: flavodoxin domain-containing protein [Lacticaseibacillus]MDE3281765.1 flavodoxin domain-containing protein [Lacticaseibacillus casei]WLV78700.1 flavodoxin domain-containing protein [Lacticaseibacillus sp. NCIMB 15471]
MQQTLVVYTSETGFTQRFALSIAQTLHCEVIDVQFLTASDLKNRTLIIYGGHLVGNKVLGLKSFFRQFKDMLPDMVIVFGSGVVRRDNVNCQQIKQYQLMHECPVTSFYYVQGYPKLSQMNFLRRLRAIRALKHWGSESYPAVQEAIQPLVADVTSLLNGPFTHGVVQI